MTGDEYRAELRRLMDLDSTARQHVAVYAGRIINGLRSDDADQRAFEDAVGRIDETWPLIVQLLRQAPDVNPG